MGIAKRSNGAITPVVMWAWLLALHWLGTKAMHQQLDSRFLYRLSSMSTINLILAPKGLKLIVGRININLKQQSTKAVPELLWSPYHVPTAGRKKAENNARPRETTVSSGLFSRKWGVKPVNRKIQNMKLSHPLSWAFAGCLCPVVPPAFPSPSPERSAPWHYLVLCPPQHAMICVRLFIWVTSPACPLWGHRSLD